TWSNTSNASASDGSYATASLSNSGVSHYLTATNFSAAIDTGATIKGIQVRVKKSYDLNRETSPLNLSTFSTSGSGSSYGYLGGGYQIAWENASNAASSNNAYAQSSAKVTRVPGEEGSGFTFGFHTGTY